MDALDFIAKQGKTRRQSVYVLSGDEELLKRHALQCIQTVALGDVDPELAVSRFAGDSSEFSTIRNELASVSFFSDRRLVIVDAADPFVTKFRSQLEAYVASPAATGVLVLDVKAFPATTNLAKAIPDGGHIVCKAPAERYLSRWSVDWCAAHYGKKISNQAAQLLVELIGSALGIIDQELQKLCDFVGDRPSIEMKDVDDLVGRSRGANIFRILDAIGAGRPALAIEVLEEAFTHGDDPMKVLAALGVQLRRLGRVARLSKQGYTLDDAMQQAGVPSFAREAARTQLVHLGRHRLDKLYDWLLEIDSGIKGGSPLPDRMQIERFIVRLARQRVS